MKIIYAIVVLTLNALPAASQEAKNISRAVTLVKTVPARATMKQVRKLLPAGAKWQTQKTTASGGWTFITLPFRGDLNGQFVFANQRKAPKRKSGFPPPPPFSDTRTTVLAGDQIQYVEIFLDTDSKTKMTGATPDLTAKYVGALVKVLGKPAMHKNTGTQGGPDAIGSIADWKLPGGRLVEFRDSFPLLSDGPRPILRLSFGYSKIYRP